VQDLVDQHLVLAHQNEDRFEQHGLAPSRDRHGAALLEPGLEQVVPRRTPAGKTKLAQENIM